MHLGLQVVQEDGSEAECGELEKTALVAGF
jgi:hypothetical protein